MTKTHFYKMMDIIDTELREKGIDIKYPSFWYIYGSVTDFNYLNQIVPKGFKRYLKSSFVVYPTNHRYESDYCIIDNQTKSTISSVIRSLCNKYKYSSDNCEYRSNYLKNKSYALNSPYTFNTLFQDYIQIIKSVNKVAILNTMDDIDKVPLNSYDKKIMQLLDKLLVDFPCDYAELEDFNILWYEVSKLALHHINGVKKYDYLLKLQGLFWGTYSKGIRSRHNQNFPDECVSLWKDEYDYARVHAESKMKELKEEILTVYKPKFYADTVLVSKALNLAYESNLSE
jgi:hypothetical protein